MTTCHTKTETRLGELTLVADQDTLVGVYFPHHWYLPKAELIGELVPADSSAVFRHAADELSQYLAGARSAFTVPYATHGNPFQARHGLLTMVVATRRAFSTGWSGRWSSWSTW
jgi:methylated-DNA-[protein]-cysteine S-methyltransferase